MSVAGHHVDPHRIARGSLATESSDCSRAVRQTQNHRGQSPKAILTAWPLHSHFCRATLQIWNIQDRSDKNRGFYLVSLSEKTEIIRRSIVSQILAN
jgi:hypothetical protein